MRSTNFFLRQCRLTLFVGLFFTFAIQAQNTIFSHQGKLPNEITPATGTFEFEVKLFDALAGGTQIGATNSVPVVEVKTRAFTVWLDFGAAAFPGADRFIEVSARRSGSNQPFTVVEPRTQILSVPYAIRALNATTADNALNLNGVDVNDFVQTTDSRLSDSRNPNPDSNNYIQNTTTQQTGANFNIDGSGTAGGTLSGRIVNAATRFDIGGLPVLSVEGLDNLFVGTGSGSSNTTGSRNSFVGEGAGTFNTTGSDNSFVGRRAGFSNTTGSGNSFVGEGAGFKNTTGDNNSFVGGNAGFSNTTGSRNSFVGENAGIFNSTGSRNSFVGENAGIFNSTGSDNSFVGGGAGFSNSTGSDNSFVGVGAGFSNTTGSNNTIIGVVANVGSGNLSFATAIGSGAVVGQSNTIALGRSDGSDKVRVFGLGAAGSTQLCRNADNEISTCSSSLRYKTNIAPFGFGLNLVNRLQPITFKWRDGGMSDLGLGAEDVAAIEPLLVTYNVSGEVEGVKYDRIGVVLLNAVKQQQAQIDKQNKQIEQQQLVIDGLKKLVCQTNRHAKVCRQEKKK